MERYENLGLVGEGSYGMVLKCRHKETGQLVAIKKFLESEDDKMVKKIAMREIKMLKQLQHANLVNLIETFRRRKRLYLVFEFVDHTVLDELEKCPNGLDENTCRKILWQVLKGTEFCHLHHIIHRDIKPENILVSKSGIVKICDFGFARTLAQPGEAYTDYVATRWYRSPELLVGDTKYGRAVDIWAVGCLLSEMLTGEPLFPGDSDIDQLYHIIRCFGNLTPRHKEVFQRNPLFVGMRLPESRDIVPLEKKFTRVSTESLNLMKQCLLLDPDKRPTCTELLKHNLFTRDGFAERFPIELKQKLHHENTSNPLLKSRVVANRQQSEDKDNAENKQPQNTDSGKGVTKKKKKTDHKESKEEKNSEDKPKRKAIDSEHKSPSKQMVPSPPKTLSTTPTQKTNTNSITLPPAAGGAGMLSNSHSNRVSPEEESTSNRNNSHDHKDPSTPSLSSPAHVIGSIPPISNTLSVPFRNSEKALKKGGSHPKKSMTVSHHHSTTVSPQGLMSEKSALHDKSLEKGMAKLGGSPERDYEERPSLSLPEVKGADVSNKTKDKHLFVQRKSNVSSIPHIATLDMISTNSNHHDSSLLPSDKDFGSSGLPNV